MDQSTRICIVLESEGNGGLSKGCEWIDPLALCTVSNCIMNPLTISFQECALYWQPKVCQFLSFYIKVFRLDFREVYSKLAQLRGVCDHFGMHGYCISFEQS